MKIAVGVHWAFHGGCARSMHSDRGHRVVDCHPGHTLQGMHAMPCRLYGQMRPTDGPMLDACAPLDTHNICVDAHILQVTWAQGMRPPQLHTCQTYKIHTWFMLLACPAVNPGSL